MTQVGQAHRVAYRFILINSGVQFFPLEKDSHNLLNLFLRAVVHLVVDQYVIGDW
jgi:hypothetical protein